MGGLPTLGSLAAGDAGRWGRTAGAGPEPCREGRSEFTRAAALVVEGRLQHRHTAALGEGIHYPDPL